MLSNQLILYCPLLLLPSVLPSIRVFSNESVLHIRWPKYWRFSFSISLSNEYSGLIYFTIDCFDLLVLQGTLKSLLQHHSSKAYLLYLGSHTIMDGQNIELSSNCNRNKLDITENNKPPNTHKSSNMHMLSDSVSVSLPVSLSKNILFMTKENIVFLSDLSHAFHAELRKSDMFF